MAAEAVKLDKPTERRLLTDTVIWLVTVGPKRRPHAVPVWFWWDGSSFLIYSLPGQKVRDIVANPNVQLHLNTDRSGDRVFRVEGRAEILKDAAPAYRVSKYIAKYRDRIKSYGWTPKGFSDQYHVALRVKPSRIRS
jgi:PPOX class probable F420-dependent enzyme